MAWFRKIKAGLVKSEITEFAGEDGNIFFNIETGELRISDGETPHGHPIYLLPSETESLIKLLISEAFIEETYTVTGASITSVNTPANLKIGTQAIYLNGVRLREGTDNDYTINSTTIEFLNGWELFNNDTINIIYVLET